ncbi:phosphate transport system regulatory protein PhoU [Dorea sp. OM02-2LB]|nr:phosphate transport system regulatory protein PhoU [Dorea sp. OM02-2LB]
MRNRFDRQLALLDENMIRMGELCELAINRVIKALTGGSVEEARAVIEADDEIDHMEKDIERLCLKLLLQQQPVAKDLRRISAALKMITDMERIGDQTADIADIVIAANMCEVQDVRDITIMADEAGKMVRDSVAAYVEKDLEKACQVMKSDDVVDDLFEKIRGELIAFIAEKQGKDGSEVIDLLMISKYLERIGDHATNIAEWVEFSITGVHKGGEKI